MVIIAQPNQYQGYEHIFFKSTRRGQASFNSMTDQILKTSRALLDRDTNSKTNTTFTKDINNTDIMETDFNVRVYQYTSQKKFETTKKERFFKLLELTIDSIYLFSECECTRTVRYVLCIVAQRNNCKILQIMVNSCIALFNTFRTVKSTSFQLHIV